MTLHNFIGGAPAPAASGQTFDNPNPATGQRLAKVARSGPADVDAAAQAARRAFEGPWRGWSANQRADLLDRIADAIEARLDELAALESADQGKPVSLAATVDIPRAVANFRFFAGAARHQQLPSHPMAQALNYTARRPVGVFGLITPWNLPLYLLTWKTAPALAMGNTVVAKPSELTPMTAGALAEIIHGCGAPEGVFNVVHGFGAEAGQALVAHPGVKGISFTGGTVTGQRVAATAAPMFKKLSLELGGKNATVIFADADLDRAIATAGAAAFRNQGEICLCGSRILVERPVYDRVLMGLTEYASSLTVGPPDHPDTTIGSLVSLDHRAKVEGYVALAREEGGTVHCGGTRPALPAPYDQGAFLSPAVVSGLPISCRTATEEIFGPVVTVHPFDTEAEALEMANGVRYGLSASVWTNNLRRGHRFSEALDVGMVWVNTWMLRDLRVPFGGVKDSGVGREGGDWSLEFYSENKNICIHLG
ncbi:MAG: aldehyde dehydrogenase [Alphaproteobacteria bacterium]|nr:aldehyde dehydrogenase [Alphaproteobacteria bacterium]